MTMLSKSYNNGRKKIMSMYNAYHRMFDINSFADIEKRYNETKPIAGKNKHLNIIPVDDRKRKWERLEKISDDCYAIYDGEMGDPLPNRWGGYYDAQKCLTPEVSLALAPIVWTRVKDGYTIRIRNGSGDYAHVSRYSFLNRAMPTGLEFVQTGQGRQYIGLFHRVDRFSAHLEFLDQVFSRKNNLVTSLVIHLSGDD